MTCRARFAWAALLAALACIGPAAAQQGPAEGQAAPSPASRPAETKKFDIPVWHADARWEIELYAGCSSPGHLDGPRLEMEYFSAGGMGRLYRPKGAGRYVFSSYDPDTERGHEVAGGAQGYLDGPFSRARFGGWDYVVRSQAAGSRDGRYLYFTDGYNGHVLRCLDLKTQWVRTLLPDTRGLLGLTTDPQGRLFVLKGDGQIVLVSPEGATENGVKVSMPQQIPGWGASLAFDEVHQRIYATAYGMKDWYVWYWDLKGGSFVGVLPIPPAGAPRRARNEPGPFEGTNLYNEGSVLFGPDDPQKRFLYVGRVDTWGLFRLDLEKKEVWALTAEGKSPRVARFIGQGRPATVPFYGGGGWQADGSIVSTVHSPYNTWRFRRVK
jgi:hypothetical protein